MDAGSAATRPGGEYFSRSAIWNAGPPHPGASVDLVSVEPQSPLAGSETRPPEAELPTCAEHGHGNEHDPISVRLSLPELLELYGTEAERRRALYRWRWPAGSHCPACGGRHRLSFRRGGQTLYQCRACQHQTTLISGTLLASTKLPLTTWLLAIYLLTSTKTNLAALELKRHLGVCYRTAWRLKH